MMEMAWLKYYVCDSDGVADIRFDNELAFAGDDAAGSAVITPQTIMILMKTFCKMKFQLFLHNDGAAVSTDPSL